MNYIPLLDIQVFHDDRTLFVEQLRSACHNVGFFLLKHDISPALIQEQLHIANSFFDQPIEEKMKISYENSPSFRGYMQLGVENTDGTLDFREQVEFATEYDSTTDLCYQWPPYQRLKSQNPWPDESMKRVCTDYANAVCRIADCIRIALCLALKLPNLDVLSDYFSNAQEPPHWVMKLISYPPVTNDQMGKQGVGAHTDTNFLTLVLQDQVGGLQVLVDDNWIDVPCLGNHVLVCNLGEQTEIWSNGYFLATPHRVQCNSLSQRLSVPLFYNPSLTTRWEPISDISSLHWQRSNERKTWSLRSNTILASVGENTFKSLARSHPNVFAKHHSDLQVLPDGRIIRRGTDGTGCVSSKE